MSKSVKKIIGVVAAIVVPFAAPAIAGAMLSSAGIAAVTASGAATGAMLAASTLTGAALGAGSAALTGGDVGRGALLGGIGGGIGGYAKPSATLFNKAPITAGTAAPAAGGTTLAGGPTLANAGVTPTGQQILTGSAPGLATTTAGTTAAAAAPQTFSQALMAKFTPTALADLTLRAAGQLAGSALAGQGLSAEEQQLVNAQKEELAWLQQNNRGLFEQRLREAQALLGESRYFDPEYFGLQAARRQQLLGAAQERQNLRGLTGAQRTAEQRRIRLGTARNVGTAYDVGYGSGVSGRLQTRQAGLAALPEGAPSTYGGYQGLAETYARAEQGRQANLEGIGDLFGSFTGRSQAQKTGIETEEERKRRAGLLA